MIRWALAIVIVAHALSGHAYVMAWRSNLSLWTWAQQQAPLNTRAQFNYGRYLLAAGHEAEGLHALAYASALERLR